ncbi:MAG: hypothetical protein JNK48_06140 [Bryobacterales bacterium]|nr:hypothetical protein [Bryobacterales bacterium]
MLSQAQLDANRANARLSTGPLSQEGKSTVSHNALKHGLSAKYVPLSDSERPQFEALETSLRNEIQPAGALQESAFQDLVAAAWKRSVVNRLLAEASSSTASLFDDDPSDRVRKLLRHKADQDRAFLRALRLLKELQTNRQLLAEAAPASTPGLVDYAKVTKQTQSQTRFILEMKAKLGLDPDPSLDDFADFQQQLQKDAA